jgi:hypothetical protein
MKKYGLLMALLAAVLVLGVARAQAEAVGKFTQVEGRVDLLKGGQLPATPVKVGAAVEPKDVIRTKSLSKAQITFIDNSVLTISPGSRIAIEEYMVNTVQGKRRAVLQVFQGLALAVINKIFKVEEPDFVVKTQTAITGVRGTEFGIRILPNSSTIMNFKGLLQVGNIFPEISQLFLKAFKVAYSFGPVNNESGRWVFLKAMQATTVARDLPPTLPYRITVQDREMFMRLLTSVTPLGSAAYQGPAQNTVSAGLSQGPESSTAPVSFKNPSETGTLAMLNTATVPPALLPQTTQISIQTYNFSQVFEGMYQKPSESPYAVAIYQSTSPGSGTRTGVYPANFTADFQITATGTSGLFSSFNLGTFSAQSFATVTGPAGGTLTGTMQMNASTSGGTAFTLSGPVSLSPNGNLSYQTTGTFTLAGATGTTTGTWTQLYSAATTTALASSNASTTAPLVSQTGVPAAGTQVTAGATAAPTAITTTPAPAPVAAAPAVPVVTVTSPTPQTVGPTVAPTTAINVASPTVSTPVPAGPTVTTVPAVSPTVTPVAIAAVTPTTTPVSSPVASPPAK